jgi:hypothetical protein
MCLMAIGDETSDEIRAHEARAARDDDAFHQS